MEKRWEPSAWAVSTASVPLNTMPGVTNGPPGRGTVERSQPAGGHMGGGLNDGGDKTAKRAASYSSHTGCTAGLVGKAPNINAPPLAAGAASRCMQGCTEAGSASATRSMTPRSACKVWVVLGVLGVAAPARD